MKKIGIVDYFIDEWHSNFFISHFKKACEELKTDYEIAYGWAELYRFEQRLSTDEWCKKNGITKCETIEELCEKSDNIMILAPANPEKHLEYAEKILCYKKDTFIDKTFTTSFLNAQKIYNIANKYGTRLFSSSAFRFADELNAYTGNIKSLSITGNGRAWEEYIIHQIEIAVAVLKAKPDYLYVFDRTEHLNVIIQFGDITCSLNYANSGMPFTLDIHTDSTKNSSFKNIESDYFYNLLKSILTFFTTGNPPFEASQTLMAMKIRDAIIKGKTLPVGTKIEI